MIFSTSLINFDIAICNDILQNVITNTVNLTAFLTEKTAFLTEKTAFLTGKTAFFLKILHPLIF